ncbi:MAG: sulfoxide reductase heme-binding subunit YedZ [Myxococcaceae bacterium]|nr:sulfoxide reductase heme-binding subunit YedZ [Myxococcaceae bacterium]
MPGLVLGAASAWLTWVLLALGGHLGADPVDTLIDRFGKSTLWLLVATMACTPLQQWLGWTWPARVRRALGLLTFAGATLHIGTYALVDQQLDLGVLLDDVTKRPFITWGFFAFVLIVPLALTSTNGWVKRLGYRVWKRLHRLVYVVVALGVLHFLLRVKKDVTEPLLFGAVFAALLLARVVWALRGD